MKMSTKVHSSRPRSERRHHGTSSYVSDGISADDDERPKRGSGSSATTTRKLRESFIFPIESGFKSDKIQICQNLIKK
jgi:hypothetical protein